MKSEDDESSETPSVVIAEDDRDLAELYATWLQDRCRVAPAYDGAGALAAIDRDTDVVVLDRQLPDLSGDSVLRAVRNREADCRVAMVTAVEPGFDIVEMGFDDYLVKPVSRDELRALIDQLLLRSTYDEQLQQFFSLVSKKATLDATKSDAEIDASQEYRRLEDELAVVRTDVDETVSELIETGAYRKLWREIAHKQIRS
ncbi:HalX domain-containing protein [Halobacteria archaeon AArc-dxtr1]|nr:HalX domain-containing protein [Halobacteria archaeon AArc-dxtr1]